MVIEVRMVSAIVMSLNVVRGVLSAHWCRSGHGAPSARRYMLTLTTAGALTPD